MARANLQTFWWSLFAAGGVVAALTMPALIFITGIAIPFVCMETVPNVRFTNRTAKSVVGHPLGGLVLFIVICLSLFHCAHRIVHTSKDLGIHNAQVHNLISVLFYGGALVLSGVAVWVIWL